MSAVGSLSSDTLFTDARCMPRTRSAQLLPTLFTGLQRATFISHYTSTAISDEHDMMDTISKPSVNYTFSYMLPTFGNEKEESRQKILPKSEWLVCMFFYMVSTTTTSVCVCVHVRVLLLLLLLLQTFYGPLSFAGTTRESRYQKGKTNLDLLEQEIVSGSGISWAICKSASHRRQITMPASHHYTVRSGCTNLS